MNQLELQAWQAFACAALPLTDIANRPALGANLAGEIADAMLREWRKRLTAQPAGVTR
jgi:hypothetical protein